MRIKLLRYSQSGLIVRFDKDRINLIPRFEHKFRNVKKEYGANWDVNKTVRWYSNTKMQVIGFEFELNIKCTK